jgi:surfeit locus 1 family protein
MILCSLGTWQLFRLQEKEALLSRLELELSDDTSTNLVDARSLSEQFEYRRGTASGRYDFKNQIFLTPRSHDSQRGKHIITPLTLRDGTTLLVNRGWVPLDWTQQSDGTPARATLTGLLRPPPRSNAFTPANDPANNQWYTAAPAEIAVATKLDNIAPYIFYPDNLTEAGTYPIHVDGRPNINNNHLQYALFWFAMAGILLVIYGLRFFPRKTG